MKLLGIKKYVVFIAALMGFFFLIVKNSQYKFLSLGFEIQKKADFFSSNVSCIVKLKKLEYLDLILTGQLFTE